MVDFQNLGEHPRTIQAHLSGSVVFYTGVMANHFKDQDLTVSVPAYQSEQHQQSPKVQQGLFGDKLSYN